MLRLHGFQLQLCCLNGVGLCENTKQGRRVARAIIGQVSDAPSPRGAVLRVRDQLLLALRRPAVRTVHLARRGACDDKNCGRFKALGLVVTLPEFAQNDKG